MLQRFKAIVDNISVWKKGIAVISIPLLVLVLTLFLTMWHEKVARAAQNRVMHSLQVKASLYKILALITDSETGVRGYLLWNDSSFLESYFQGRARVTPAIEQLQLLVENQPQQTSATRALDNYTRAKLNALRTEVNDPKTARSQLHPVVVESWKNMKAIRNLVRDMEITEETLMNQKIREFERQLNYLEFALLLLFVIAILYGITATYIVSSSILQRVNDLENYARRVSRGQEAEWEDTGEDELGLLGRSVKIMTNNLLAREDALRQTRWQLQKANESLEAQLSETQAVNQELEAFSYSVSHDLRAPLRHITGFAELLENSAKDLDPKSQRYVGIIKTSVQQMGVLIDELLEFSRLGRTEIKSDPVDLNKVLEQVINDLSPEITERNISWKLSELPTVKGDKVMLQLVFQNLIGNAIKYSRDRDPAIIEVREDTTNVRANQKCITVADNGTGFDMDQKEKLFRVFQRLHSSEEFEGTGVGLATVKRIVKRHGGEVSARGELGKGSEFTITLPAAAPEVSEAQNKSSYQS